MADSKKTVVVAIIQARLGSSRLPLKSLLCLRGQPVIDWVASRVAKAAALDSVVVAVPDTPLDLVLADYLQTRKIACVTGPEDDVLKRFRLAADASGATHIVRVCADNPLVWSEAIDRLVRFHFAGGYDYSYNHVPRGNSWPDGLGAEIVSVELLRQLDEKAQIPTQREHCLNYIWDHWKDFKTGTFDPVEGWLRRPDLKLDLDGPEDFRKLSLLPLHPEMDARAVIDACDYRLRKG